MAGETSRVAAAELSLAWGVHEAVSAFGNEAADLFSRSSVAALGVLIREEGDPNSDPVVRVLASERWKSLGSEGQTLLAHLGAVTAVHTSKALRENPIMARFGAAADALEIEGASPTTIQP